MLFRSNYLKENGYDGLFFSGECACLIDDLARCSLMDMECEPGYIGKCTCERNCTFDMYAEKPQKGNKEYLGKGSH